MAVALLHGEGVGHRDLHSLGPRIARNSRAFYVHHFFVDLGSLIRKIEGLTLCQKVALLDAVETYWWCLTCGIAKNEAETLRLAGLGEAR